MSTHAATPRLVTPAGWSRSRRHAGAVAAHGALAALLGCCVAIALAAAGGDSFLIDTQSRGFPAWITGPLGGISDTIGRPRFLALVGVMWVAYAVLLAASERVSARVALGVVVAVHVVLALAPPLMSTDIFSYLDYGRLGVLHGLNPYVHPPAAAPGDAAFSLVGERWRDSATAYGPLFTLLSFPLAWLSFADAVWVMKGLVACASLACVGLVWRCARLRGRDPLRPALLVGLNPVLLVYALGGGHNDLIMIALMLGAVALALGDRERSAGGVVVASLLIKASAVVVVPFMLLSARRPRHVLGGVAVAAALAVVLSVLVFDGQSWRMLGVLQDQQSLVSAGSFPHLVAGMLGVEQTLPVSAIAHGVLAAIALALLLAVRRGADWVAASGWMLLALVLTTSFFMPWYTVWALPLAAVGRDRRLVAATLFIQALFFVHQLTPVIAS